MSEFTDTIRIERDPESRVYVHVASQTGAVRAGDVVRHVAAKLPLGDDPAYAYHDDHGSVREGLSIRAAARVYSAPRSVTVGGVYETTNRALIRFARALQPDVPWVLEGTTIVVGFATATDAELVQFADYWLCVNRSRESAVQEIAKHVHDDLRDDMIARLASVRLADVRHAALLLDAARGDDATRVLAEAGASAAAVMLRMAMEEA